MNVKRASQTLLFDEIPSEPTDRTDTSSTFVDNISLPVHRWFRFSAGFSADWAESVIDVARMTGETRVLDPFCGSGTTLLAAENVGVESIGIEAHPFLYRTEKNGTQLIIGKSRLFQDANARIRMR
jgi:tRNA G10  N-methylase Trm11